MEPFRSEPLYSLPEIFCLWAGEPHDLMRRNTKDLAGLIPPR